jgi:protein SCO1/2
VTFTYTRCPLPTYCPAQDRRFAELQHVIRDRPGLAKVQLVSVSIDPDYDRPAVLNAHAARLGADPAIWRFVTGQRDEVLAFAASLALTVVAETPASSELLHSVRTAVVDSDGRLVRRYDGTGWQAIDLLRDLESR